MTRPSIETLKKSSHIFKTLSDAGVERFVSIAETKVFDVGDTLMNEGEPGDSFIILESGRVDVSIDVDGNAKSVAELTDGACVGEIGAVAMEPRSATVRAVEKTSVFVFDAEKSREILKDFPKVRELIMKVALKRSEENLFA